MPCGTTEPASRGATGNTIYVREDVKTDWAYPGDTPPVPPGDGDGSDTGDDA